MFAAVILSYLTKKGQKMIDDSDLEDFTLRQRRFVVEYCIDQNGAQSAIRAGYSDQAAREIASRLLTKRNIKDAVDKRMKDIAEVAMVDAVWALQKRKEIVDRCTTPGEFFDTSGANKALDAIENRHLKLADTTENKDDQTINVTVKSFAKSKDGD
jgi:phage terminase small subunit